MENIIYLSTSIEHPNIWLHFPRNQLKGVCILASILRHIVRRLISYSQCSLKYRVNLVTRPNYNFVPFTDRKTLEKFPLRLLFIYFSLYLASVLDIAQFQFEHRTLQYFPTLCNCSLCFVTASFKLLRTTFCIKTMMI